jgi:hypothetical protein
MAQETFILEIARYLKANYRIDGITAHIETDTQNFWWHYHTKYPTGKFPERYDVLINISQVCHVSPPRYTAKDIAFFKAAAQKAHFHYEHGVEDIGRLIFEEKESPLEKFAEELIGQWEERSEKFDVFTKIPNCDLSPVELIEATKLFLRALKLYGKIPTRAASKSLKS